MKQMTVAAAKGFEVHDRATCKAEFLARMKAQVRWAEFCALIELHYLKAGNGRPPVGLERMYLIVNWFIFADEACEDARDDIAAFGDFCHIDLGRGRVPDATSLLHFRHLWEQHQLGAVLFAKVGELMQAGGMKLNGGTIVDATLIDAPHSPKNREGERDPQMRNNRKGKKGHFSQKLHIGVDCCAGLIRSAKVAAKTSTTPGHARSSACRGNPAPR